jgi:hypothetical protein
LFFPRFIVSAAALVVLPVAASGKVADLPRTSDAFVIDGHLDEPAWASAIRIDLEYEINPAENGVAPVATRAFLIEDGESLLIAFEADDPDPESIRAYLKDRDSAWSDDYVGIMLDTYNDERRAFEFYANPLGVQMDKTIDDTAGGNRWEIDDSWDAIWESAGRINGEGYVVEMRIPLSQLRFPDVDGRKTWGYSLRRAYPRDRDYVLSSNQMDRNRNCTLCQSEKFQGLEGSHPGRDLEIVPTLTASQNETTEDPAIEPPQSGDPEVDAGLTVRWGITPDLTANITINPDFSQIEADVAQLDVNNRFTLFFPEKRPFFLEGADYFNTPMDVIFTRTVAEPDFGAKITGKKGPNTFGLFAAEDRVTNLLFPGLYGSDTETLEQSNTAFVGRYSYGFENTSSLGAVVTGRKGDGYHNYLAGIDGRWKINDQHSLEFQHVMSDTEYPVETAIEFEQPLGNFDGDGTLVRYRYETRTWFARANYYDYDEGLRADSGFEKQVGGVLSDVSVGRVFYGTDDNRWDQIRTHVNFERLEDGQGVVAERKTSARFSISGPMQTWFSLVLMDGEERDEGVLYDVRRARIYFELVPTGGLYLGTSASFGDQIDYTNNRLGKRKAFEPFVTWNMSRNLFLRVQGVYSELDTPDGTPIFEAILADTRLTWQFNLRSFLRLTVQYQDIERNPDVYIEPTDAREKEVGRQLLYSYKINPQTVFFLGYSDQYMDNDALDGLTESDRTVFMKIGYAWTP